jgi:hypothetical protein
VYRTQAHPEKLRNVHLSLLGKQGGGDSSIHSVKGDYIYFHYMQDGFNDAGWGCAYRSLQTLFSWFLLNGYTTKPVPSIPDIQKLLVEIGDKQPKFIGRL